MRSYELRPVYDGRKSFYGKAMVALTIIAAAGLA